MKSCIFYMKLFTLRITGILNLITGIFINNLYGREFALFNLILGVIIIFITLFIEDHRLFCSICSPIKYENEELARMLSLRLINKR